MELNKAYNRDELVKFLRTSFLPEDFIQEGTLLANQKQFQYTQQVTRLDECKSLELQYTISCSYSNSIHPN